MSTRAKSAPLSGGRPLSSVPGSGSRGPGLGPLPPSSGGARRWLRWLVVVPALLILLTYLAGRMVEPVRARLEGLPVAGKLLFSRPVWQVLWNKPAEPAKSATTATTSQPAAQGTTTQKPDFSKEEAEIAARLAAVQVKENDLKAREALLKSKEDAAAADRKKLDQQLRDSAALQTQLQSQMRSEQDKAEVVRNMRSTAQVQLLGAMTDDEVLTVLKYFPADEVAKVLGSLDPYRAARLLQRLPQVAPSLSTP